MKTAEVLFVLAFSFIIRFAYATPLQEEQFQQAIHMMETKGDYKNAITLFEEIATGLDRSLAARALLYVGICYEKMGQDKAAETYERIINEFRDQDEAVTEAQTRLDNLRVSEGRMTDGMAVRQIWTGDRVDPLGSVSNDGRFISFVDWDSGDLALHDVKTGENRRITNNGTWDTPSQWAYYSAISRDDKQVAFSWLNENRFFDVRVVGQDGSNLRLLYANKDVYPDHLDWTNDGEFLAATLSDQIGLISTKDGSVRILKTMDSGYTENIKISPDGNYIAYDFPQDEDNPQYDIFLLATDDGTEIPVVTNPGDDFVLGWSPDGNHLYYRGELTGSMDIWSLQITDGTVVGQAQLVKKDIGNSRPMGFTDDGALCYVIDSGMKDVLIAEIDMNRREILKQPRRPATRFWGTTGSPAWSKDGKYLAYISKRSAINRLGSRTLILYALEDSSQREIPLLNLADLWRIVWSPDGQYIYGIGRDAKHRGIYGVAIATGQTRPVVLDSINLASWPEIPTDGRLLYYLDRNNTIQSFEFSTRAIEEVHSLDGTRKIKSFALTSDGDRLAVLARENNLSTIQVVTLDDGQSRDLLTNNHLNYERIEWTPDETSIIVSLRDPTFPKKLMREVFVISSQTGESQSLGLKMDALTVPTLHPDGKQIAFVGGLHQYEIWAMENFISTVASTK